MNPSSTASFCPRRITRHILLGMASLPAAFAVPIPILTGTGSYSQDFDALPSSGPSLTWADDSTLAGWYSQRTGTGTSILADAGSGTGGNLYSYGATSTTDRALGSIGSSNATAGGFAHGVQLRNTSGSAVTINALAYTGEQWRKSSDTAAQAITLWYKTGTASITTLDPADDSGWTALAAGDFSSPIQIGAGTALDGNDPANRTAIAINPNISVPNGIHVMIRWKDIDHPQTDHGLAIDDVAISWIADATVAITLSAVPSTFAENAGAAAATGTVTIPATLGTNLVIHLASSDPTEASVSATATITVGETSASFPIDAVNDLVADGSQAVTLTASASGYTAGTCMVMVNDDGDVPATLSPGAIAFVGFNADGDDDLAFVALARITETDRILITDTEWNGLDLGAGGAFTPGEGLITWAAPAGGVSVGTVVTLNSLSSAERSASVGAVTASGSFNLGSENETVYAYQGSAASPTGFLAVIATHRADPTTGTGLSASHLVYLPNDVDVAIYIGARSDKTSFAAYLAPIGDPANWLAEDGTGDQHNNLIAPDLPFANTAFTLATGSSYATWAAANAPGQAANLDHDGDGMPNGVEYFMGASGSGFTPHPAPVNGKLTWPHATSATGTYSVMISTDLITWSPTTSGVVDTGTAVEYTLPSGHARIFVCLEVVPTP
ncbi:MAG: hypothetical protein NTW21_20400 [Verrucomicrobia bacterium]|nr:hypothetical protein [Verrucomicrobiota bacterium]